MRAVHLDLWQKCLHFVELHAQAGRAVVWCCCCDNVAGVYWHSEEHTAVSVLG
jgi:hypothetical protein